MKEIVRNNEIIKIHDRLIFSSYFQNDYIKSSIFNELEKITLKLKSTIMCS